MHHIHTGQPVKQLRSLLALLAQVIERPTALLILETLLRYYVQGTGRLAEDDIRCLLQDMPVGERFGLPVEVYAIVVVVEEDRLTVVAALHDMNRYARKDKASLARHGSAL